MCRGRVGTQEFQDFEAAVMLDGLMSVGITSELDARAISLPLSPITSTSRIMSG